MSDEREAAYDGTSHPAIPKYVKILKVKRKKVNFSSNQMHNTILPDTNTFCSMKHLE